MKKIVSVSRRTDIPAFYGDWFMCRVREGFAGVVNPFGGRKYLVSLRPEDVTCFVLWSKDLTPFLAHLKTLDKTGYNFYFNYTVTGLPSVFESGLDKDSALKTLKLLSRTYSPAHINWRFDPIIPCSICDNDHFLSAFTQLARELEGLVERCYFSFVTEYGRVKRNFEQLRRETGITITEVSEQQKIDLANQIADIAGQHGIEMYSCCGEYLLGEKIKKAHCVDGAIIERLFYPEGLPYKERPTRDQCGCTESSDIGAYNTCPHGCIYCYANANKTSASASAANHDPQSAFLGFNRQQSDRWLKDIGAAQEQTDSADHPHLF